MTTPDTSDSVPHFTEYHTRVAAYAVILDDQDNILLAWFNGGANPARASWTLPGGGVEFGEQIEDALVREVHEETGFEVELSDFLTTSTVSVPAGPHAERGFRAVRIVFTARVTGGVLGTLEVDGTTDFAEWVPLSQARDAAFSGNSLIEKALTALAVRNSL